jgi:hypothetical protein
MLSFPGSCIRCMQCASMAMKAIGGAVASLTIRSIPDEIVERIREVARERGRSMEQEVRDLLQERYADRSTVLQRMRDRWSRMPESSVAEVDAWIGETRKR